MFLSADRRGARSAFVVCALVLGACDAGGLVLGEPAAVVGSIPADGSRDVDRATEVRVFFDRPLAPRTVSRATVTLRSGPQQRFLSVRYDPVERAFVARDFYAQPLEPFVEHELRVEGATDLEGIEIAPFVARFFTGDAVTPLPPEGHTSWAEVSAILEERCATDGCHGGGEPALGLDLSSAEGVRSTAIGVPSRSLGVSGFGERGLGGLPRIDVVAGIGQPATSRLLYEVLRDPRVGSPMPPDEPLSDGEVRRIADWILGGAPTAP
jgi:hypothetical protein